MPNMFWNLRARITAWYVLLVALTLVVFSVVIHVRLEHNLISQLDASLEASSSQAVTNLSNKDGSLVFGDSDLEYEGEIESLTQDGLVLSDGTVFEARTNSGVIEFGNGIYGVRKTFSAEGSFSIVWDITGTDFTAGEDIQVVAIEIIKVPVIQFDNS